jgi:nitrate reductase alpha subunit
MAVWMNEPTASNNNDNGDWVVVYNSGGTTTAAVTECERAIAECTFWRATRK